LDLFGVILIEESQL